MIPINPISDRREEKKKPRWGSGANLNRERWDRLQHQVEESFVNPTHITQLTHIY